MLHDKVFLVVTDDDPDLQIITVKVDHQGDALRRDVESITSGCYLGKRHWISIGSGAGVTEQLIEHLVHASYDLVDGREPRGQS